MQNPILPESKLRQFHEEIQAFAARHRGSFSVDIDDPDYGSAFSTYIFFSLHRSASQVLGVSLNNGTRFYNAYYWFRRFLKIYTKKHGSDAGLEQQAFRMLEEAGFELDFEIIGMVDQEMEK